MNTTSLVFLFPGQGAYFPGALHAAAQQYPAVDNTLQEIDLVCRAHFKGSVRDLLVDPAGPSLEALQRRDPNMLQMAIYAASVCAYRVLEARGCEPSMLVGHSFGEIAALVCAGAFSVPQGAEIIAARSLALKPAAGSGYMAAMGASPRRCAAIIELLETPQANVAVDNGPNQTVMSGAGAAMDRVAGVAQALGISFVRLASPYPFHSAQLVPVAKAFRTAISRQDRQPSRFPTYSPILERVYEDKGDLATALSSHLVRPVRFAATIRHLRQTSDSLVFVEIGASNALIKLVQRILSDPSIPAFATLAPPSATSSRGIAAASVSGAACCAQCSASISANHRAVSRLRKVQKASRRWPVEHANRCISTSRIAQTWWSTPSVGTPKSARMSNIWIARSIET
jgi:acyl transferase domain-containing protein